jgi:hypothetical protein
LEAAVVEAFVLVVPVDAVEGVFFRVEVAVAAGTAAGLGGGGAFVEPGPKVPELIICERKIRKASKKVEM